MKTPQPRTKKTLDRPALEEWPMITEFAHRRDRFRRWTLASVCSALALAFAGLYLSAIAVLLLFPVYGALKHLRCPACDAPTTLRGVTDGFHCLVCATRLRY